jgi:hypothetical protein
MLRGKKQKHSERKMPKQLAFAPLRSKSDKASFARRKKRNGSRPQLRRPRIVILGKLHSGQKEKGSSRLRGSAKGNCKGSLRIWAMTAHPTMKAQPKSRHKRPHPQQAKSCPRLRLL